MLDSRPEKVALLQACLTTISVWLLQVRLYGGADLGGLPLAEVQRRLQQAVADHSSFADAAAAGGSNSNGSGSERLAPQLEVEAEAEP